MIQPVVVSLFISILLGVIRGVDLALWTDAESGLCTFGAVGWRYAALAAGAAAAFWAGKKTAARPAALGRRCPPLGAVALAGAGFILPGGLARLWLVRLGAGSVPQAVLEVLCAGWLLLLGLSWLRPKPWHTPTRGMVPAVLGSAIFFRRVLARFTENSSSWYRVSPTALVWQLLAALVFLTTLIRVLYLPQSRDGRTLCAAGLIAFFLCLCWELPELAAAMRTADLLDLPDLLFGSGLCCVGLLGGICAVRVAFRLPQKRQTTTGGAID